MLKFKQFDVVFVDLGITVHDFRDGKVLVIDVRKIGLELCLKFVDFDSEGVEFLLDFDGLITNDVDDILLDFIDFLLSLVEPSL